MGRNFGFVRGVLLFGCGCFDSFVKGHDSSASLPVRASRFDVFAGFNRGREAVLERLDGFGSALDILVVSGVDNTRDKFRMVDVAATKE